MRKAQKKNIIITVLAVIVIIQSCLILFLLPKKPVPPVKPPPVPKKSQIAIVIDDWGYNSKNQWFLKSVHFPVTISVLPFLPYSETVVQGARNNSRIEVMLHLPLEPHHKSEIGLEKKVIVTTMSERQILQLLESALADLGKVRGVSNHMGSKATEDSFVMRVIFQELKKRNLYFLDSVVTPDSVCSEVAEKTQVRFARRSIFLDNKPSKDYIRGQLVLLVKKARQNKRAIGIGHDRQLTLEVLQEFFGELKESDIELVPVSQLVR